MPFLKIKESSTLSSSSTPTIAEHIKLRRPRNEMSQPIDPTTQTRTQTQTQIQSTTTRSKSTISSLFNSTNKRTTTTQKKKLNNTFKGFGCTAASSQQVSLPAVIRTSADWDGSSKKVEKKKHKTKTKTNKNNNDVMVMNNNNEASTDGSNSNSNINLGSCSVVGDVWCGPGIRFSADAVVGSVDCVVSSTRRNMNVSGRGKIDVDKVHHVQRERETERERQRKMEHYSCFLRRTVNPESFPSPFPESDFSFASTQPELDVFGPRYYRNVWHPSPDGLAEIMMLQNGLLMGGRVDSHDHFGDWRLDVDNMSYEELLELGDRIGYVSTGLKEDEISRCLGKLKNSIVNDFSSHLHMHVDKKCTICQEEYEVDDEMGKLNCGHSFHIQCIKQWLAQKNACPVCKAAVVTRC